ncbi:hypothetical protein K1728_00700 [Weissella confusa]|uniref:hypothetical protein n=1 Tax=Weissella confusa TaxID=1583 RepID=UPI001C6FAAA4|nr:hypothetical protein [Weissella confusa]QYU57964.1 hypothetical protein K1728_00700 [Weissella confusa]
MAFLIIMAVIIFFSWRFIAAAVGGAIAFSMFVIRHIQFIFPLLLFSWVWYRFGLLVAVIITLLIIITGYFAIINIIEAHTNNDAPNSLIIQTKEQNKLIPALKATKPQDN